jgi:Uma2 family endonuclease
MSLNPTNRMSLAEYQAKIDRGEITRNDRVEFIYGEVSPMAPTGPLHAACTRYLTKLFVLRFADRFITSVQNPICVSGSEACPDIAILKPREDFYALSHAGPDDVLLIIEVADKTIDFDREVKLRLYAESGVREVWVLDIFNRGLQVYRHPLADGHYGYPRPYSGLEEAHAVWSLGEEFRVAGLFPPTT